MACCEYDLSCFFARLLDMGCVVWVDFGLMSVLVCHYTEGEYGCLSQIKV